MTLEQLLSTLAGSALLPFFIILIWGRLTARWRALGGALAAFLIIGPLWLFNHGLDGSLISQSSNVFVDMGLTTAIGVFVYGILKGGKVRQSLLNVAAALLGGLCAGLLLFLLRL